MPYFSRAFCASADVPTSDTIERAMRSVRPFEQFAATASPHAGSWSAELVYKTGKRPLVLELNVNDGPSSLAAEEWVDGLMKVLAARHEAVVQADGEGFYEGSPGGAGRMNHHRH